MCMDKPARKVKMLGRGENEVSGTRVEGSKRVPKLTKKKTIIPNAHPISSGAKTQPFD
jgi:hypothetical protein